MSIHMCIQEFSSPRAGGGRVERDGLWYIMMAELFKIHGVHSGLSEINNFCRGMAGQHPVSDAAGSHLHTKKPIVRRVLDIHFCALGVGEQTERDGHSARDV